MITEKYLNLYKQMHYEGHYGGNVLDRNEWNKFEDFFVSNNCNTLLDFGSGKGWQWKNFPWSSKPKVTCYDPAWEEHSTLPVECFDMIMSKDCLEHIPIDTLEECIKWIYEHSKICTAHFISSIPAKKNLPNGENAHCTLLTLQEYKSLFQKYSTPKVKTLLFSSIKKYEIF